MEQVKVLPKANVSSIAWFISLLAVATILPHYIHNQFITGPIVNAILFIAVIELGSGNAMLIGLIPSVAALISGLLPAVLAPMIPFIMISNAILIATFAGLRKTNYWAGVLGGTLFKYAFLFFTSTLVVNLITNKSVSAKAAATMMAWPQIITAIIGGLIAFGVLKLLNKHESWL